MFSQLSTSQPILKQKGLKQNLSRKVDPYDWTPKLWAISMLNPLLLRVLTSSLNSISLKLTIPILFFNIILSIKNRTLRRSSSPSSKRKKFSPKILKGAYLNNCFPPTTPTLLRRATIKKR